MIYHILRIWLAITLAFLAEPVLSQDFVAISSKNITVCEAHKNQTSPPDFTDPECEVIASGAEAEGVTNKLANIDPQERMIWLRVYVSISEEMLANDAPLGLFVSAKGARTVYVNGQVLDSEGKPAFSRAEEKPGRMDSLSYLQRDLLRPGSNEIILLISAHYGFLKLVYPVQIIGIGPFVELKNYLLRQYWPSLFTFGVFMIGFFYFGSVGLLRRDYGSTLLLGALSFFAAALLTAVSLRAFVDYRYPFHDIRIIALMLSAYGFGVSLFFYVTNEVLNNTTLRIGATFLVLSIVPILLQSGFDAKIFMALVLPITCSAVVAGWGAINGRPSARYYFFVLFAFLTVTLVFYDSFLNTAFFYFISVLLGFLFVRQALILIKEQDRARRLELALLDIESQKGPGEIKIKSAGKLEVVDVDCISHCSGAGDYVELHLNDGQIRLQNGSLNELENDLPEFFIRVHRSHIVNTKLVKSLIREPSGVGRLLLENQSVVPVSRRIMPRVKKALEL